MKLKKMEDAQHSRGHGTVRDNKEWTRPFEVDQLVAPNRRRARSVGVRVGVRVSSVHPLEGSRRRARGRGRRARG